MKNLGKKLKSKALVISTTISALMLSGASVYADQFSDAADQAAEGIHTSATGVVKPLLVIAGVIVGLAIAFGTAKQKESAKERVPAIVIGVAIIIGATSYAGIVFGWFQK